MIRIEKNKYLIVLVSGGRSSAFMARHIQTSPKYRKYIKLYVFCNTGMERPETINFLKDMIKYWKLPLNIIEGVYSKVPNVGVKSKLVDFDTMDMDGKVFSQAIEHLNKIKWTGVPNQAVPYCSEYLKTRVSHHFAKEIFGTTKYIKAIGYRKEDMPKRITLAELKADKSRIAPLLTDFDIPISQLHLNVFFDKEPFKLHITKAIKNNTSKDPEIAKKLNKELEEVNFLIDENAKGILSLNDGIEIAVQTAKGLADAFGSSNEELQRAVNTISNLVTSIAQGNMAGAVLTVVDWLIQGVKDVFGKDREREKRINRERLENQAAYNRLLREQLLIESRLDSEYKSRAQAITDEVNALKQNKETIKKEMESILNTFNEIFDDFVKSWFSGNADAFGIWQSLGLNEYFENGLELSDELLDKLMLLNAYAPLQGTMKELFDQLMRLKEEFGSVDAAIRELEKEKRDRLTGTTAQSLANAIKEGLASGKRSFADFADDIEVFLRNAILAGMSTKILEPQMQELQNMLESMMGDGVITEDERKRFQDMYMKIVKEANSYMDMINQAGIDISGTNQQNSLKGAIKGITEEQADLLAGQFGGLRLAQLETNQILKSSAAYQMQACSDMIKIQGQIEVNTRKSADVLELIYKHLGGTYTVNSTNSLTANGF